MLQVIAIVIKHMDTAFLYPLNICFLVSINKREIMVLNGAEATVPVTLSNRFVYNAVIYKFSIKSLSCAVIN